MTGHLIVIKQGIDSTLHVAYKARLRETRSGARIAWLTTFVPYLRYGMPTEFLVLAVVETSVKPVKQCRIDCPAEILTP